jgi:hypothetical protein
MHGNKYIIVYIMNNQNKLLQNLWNKSYSSSGKSLTMMFNFILGILPGIIYIVRNVFLDDEKVMNRASFVSQGFWVYFIAFAFQFILSIFEMVYYKRFMSVQLVRTNFVGQTLSICMLLLATSNKFIDFLRNMIKQNEEDNQNINFMKKAGLAVILISVNLIAFFIYKYSKFSELSYGSKSK